MPDLVKRKLAKLLENNLKNTLGNKLGEKKSFHFSCTACGNCCQGEGRVYFRDEDLEKIYDYLGLETGKRKTLYKKIIQKRRNGYNVHEGAGPCHFLDSNKRCSIYPVRPLQCRSFPFWPSVFASRAALAASCKECTGMRNGMQKHQGEAFTLGELVEKIEHSREQFLKAQTKKDEYFLL